MSNNAETFAASRWTKGNLFFPTRITVTPQHVSRVKPRLFGSSEESIAIGKVASDRKADAQRIRDLIEAYQTGRPE